MGKSIMYFIGHDDELNHCNAHPSQNLLLLQAVILLFAFGISGNQFNLLRFFKDTLSMVVITWCS